MDYKKQKKDRFLAFAAKTVSIMIVGANICFNFDISFCVDDQLNAITTPPQTNTYRYTMNNTVSKEPNKFLRQVNPETKEVIRSVQKVSGEFITDYYNKYTVSNGAAIINGLAYYESNKNTLYLNAQVISYVGNDSVKKNYFFTKNDFFSTGETCTAAEMDMYCKNALQQPNLWLKQSSIGASSKPVGLPVPDCLLPTKRKDMPLTIDFHDLERTFGELSMTDEEKFTGQYEIRCLKNPLPQELHLTEKIRSSEETEKFIEEHCYDQVTVNYHDFMRLCKGQISLNELESNVNFNQVSNDKNTNDNNNNDNNTNNNNKSLTYYELNETNLHVWNQLSTKSQNYGQNNLRNSAKNNVQNNNNQEQLLEEKPKSKAHYSKIADEWEEIIKASEEAQKINVDNLIAERTQQLNQLIYEKQVLKDQWQQKIRNIKEKLSSKPKLKETIPEINNNSNVQLISAVNKREPFVPILNNQSNTIKNIIIEKIQIPQKANLVIPEIPIFTPLETVTLITKPIIPINSTEPVINQIKDINTNMKPIVKNPIEIKDESFKLKYETKPTIIPKLKIVNHEMNIKKIERLTPLEPFEKIRTACRSEIRANIINRNNIRRNVTNYGPQSENEDLQHRIEDTLTKTQQRIDNAPERIVPSFRDIASKLPGVSEIYNRIDHLTSQIKSITDGLEKISDVITNVIKNLIEISNFILKNIKNIVILSIFTTVLIILLQTGILQTIVKSLFKGVFAISTICIKGIMNTGKHLFSSIFKDTSTTKITPTVLPTIIKTFKSVNPFASGNMEFPKITTEIINSIKSLWK